MSITKVSVDVHCHWSGQTPRYRLYLDDELMCERDFGWHGWELCIYECMYVKLQPGTHKLRLEQVGESGRFDLKNVLVNDEPAGTEFTTV